MTKLNLKPPGKCIFCGSNGLSKEHLWPKWLHRFLPDQIGQGHNRLRVTTSKASPMIAGVERKKKYQGGVKTIQLRVVCKSCNSGWMSALETQVKPILLPIIHGQMFALDVRAQTILATWIAMKCMIIEQSEKRDIVSTQQEREYLMRNQLPPLGWEIWIGFHNSTAWRSRMLKNATTLGLKKPGDTEVKPEGKGKNTQTIALGVGDLFIQTFFSRLIKLVRSPLGNALTQQIWPIRNSSILWPPAQRIAQHQADMIALDFRRFTKGLPWKPINEDQ